MQPRWIQTDHHRATYEAFDYVPGVVADGRFAFVSGQIGIEADGSISDDPKTQIERAFANLQAVLNAIPATPRQVVDLCTFHVGLQAQLPVVSEVKKAFFGEWNPAWTAIGVSELALPGLILEARVVVALPNA
ncbi:MAG: Rid family hydrolase [Planctomycetota bacterium]